MVHGQPLKKEKKMGKKREWTICEWQEWADLSAYANAESMPWSPEFHVIQEELEVEALICQGRLPKS